MRNPEAIAKGAEEHLFEAPTPGQSLTNSPDTPYPWEGQPEITSVKVATEKIFFDLLKEDNLTTVATLMSQKTPVADIANLLLTAGFQKGKWNPDMMLSLLEPTMYMLLAIAEKAGINPVLNREDSEVEIEEDDQEGADFDVQSVREQRNKIPEGGGFKDAVVQKINPASVGGDIKEQLKTLDSAKLRESILQKQKPALQDQPSLLGKTGV
ncbi:hypothetical protein OAN77_00200 [bacterium]|mgnify:FL=1|nr:hypothetical protein [bacterium]|tara:strand:- start:3044 stop:3676 length:633 start_codon:yes stop_codon:yes gene_type:complete